MASFRRGEGTCGWTPWVLGPVVGFLIAVSIPFAQIFVASWTGDSKSAPRPNQGSVAQKSDPASTLQPIPVTGTVRTTIRDFGLDDPAGRRVLSIERLEASVQLQALQSGRVSISKGTAKGIRLLIRKGDSGRVSLSEAFHLGSAPPPREARANSRNGMRLSIGPLAATDVRLHIAMGATPVVVELSHATLRVEREAPSDAPRIFLSDMEGTLVSPSPMAGAVDIHGGAGVIDLGGEPLADLRTRVCVARSELRLQIIVPERAPETTTLIADGEGLGGVASAGVLGVVDLFKKSLRVESGSVEVPGKGDCERSKG